jgi:hypothetical protein
MHLTRFARFLIVNLRTLWNTFLTMLRVFNKTFAFVNAFFRLPKAAKTVKSTVILFRKLQTPFCYVWREPLKPPLFPPFQSELGAIFPVAGAKAAVLRCALAP